MKTTFLKACHQTKIVGLQADARASYLNRKLAANSNDLASHAWNSQQRSDDSFCDLKQKYGLFFCFVYEYKDLPCRVLGIRILRIMWRSETTITCSKRSSSVI